jgi:hypothetical protein
MTGAIVVLAAFVANQWFRLRTDTVIYLLLNAVGTAVLAVVAGINGDLGFLLLEGVWAVVSTVGLVRAILAREPKRDSRRGDAAPICR